MTTVNMAGPDLRPPRRRRAGPRVLTALLVSALVGVPATPAVAAEKTADRRGSTVTAGPLRIQVISPTLLRLEYAQDKRFEDRPSFNASARPGGRAPAFSVRDSRTHLEIRTDALVLRQRKGAAFGAGNTTLDLTVGSRRVRVNPAFGAGRRSDALGGWYRGLDYYADQAGPVEQINLHEGLLHRDGWYLLDDTATALR